MKLIEGKTFLLKDENKPIDGCTISSSLHKGINEEIECYALSASTDISPESYPFDTFLILLDGNIKLQGKYNASLKANEICYIEREALIGMESLKDSVYINIGIRSSKTMNSKIKVGEVFSLEHLVPYQEGKIVNMDVINSDSLKLCLMAFDEGTGLSEHSAPGEALIFALDGEATIVYEGIEHTIKKGENFHFAKGGRHAVKCDKRFKMALLLTL